MQERVALSVLDACHKLVDVSVPLMLPRQGHLHLLLQRVCLPYLVLEPFFGLCVFLLELKAFSTQDIIACQAVNQFSSLTLCLLLALHLK